MSVMNVCESGNYGRCSTVLNKVIHTERQNKAHLISKMLTAYLALRQLLHPHTGIGITLLASNGPPLSCSSYKVTTKSITVWLPTNLSGDKKWKRNLESSFQHKKCYPTTATDPKPSKRETRSLVPILFESQPAMVPFGLV